MCSSIWWLRLRPPTVSRLETCHVYHLRQPYGRSSLGDYDGQATTLTKMNGMLEHDKRAHQKKVARTSSTQMSPNQHPIP